MAFYNNNNSHTPPSLYTPTEFNTRKVIVLSDLTAREREQWYNFITENNIEVSKLLVNPSSTEAKQDQQSPPTASGDSDTKGRDTGGDFNPLQQNTCYMAKVRLVVPGISKDKAVPPSMKVSSNYKAHYPKQNSSNLAVSVVGPPVEIDSTGQPITYSTNHRNGSIIHGHGSGRSDRSLNASGHSDSLGGGSKRSQGGIQHWDRIFHFRSEVIDLAEYRQFISLLKDVGPECARPRVMSWVMRAMEDVYDARYIHDTVELTNDDGLDDLDDDETAALTNRTSLDFPKFVVEFFFKRFGMRNLVEQNCWELILNVAVMRRESLAMELFSRFTMERYDADDLLFFLYVRYTVQKTLNFNFKARWTDGRSSKAQREADLWLSYRECFTISKTVFGNDQDPMCREFLHMVESQLVGKKRSGASGHDTRRIEVYQFLLLAVSTYHDARPDDGEGSYNNDSNNNSLHNNITSINSNNNKNNNMMNSLEMQQTSVTSPHQNQLYNSVTSTTNNINSSNLPSSSYHGNGVGVSSNSKGGNIYANDFNHLLNDYSFMEQQQQQQQQLISGIGQNSFVDKALYSLGSDVNINQYEARVGGGRREERSNNNYDNIEEGTEYIGEIKDMEFNNEKLEWLLKDMNQHKLALDEEERKVEEEQQQHQQRQQQQQVLQQQQQQEQQQNDPKKILDLTGILGVIQNAAIPVIDNKLTPLVAAIPNQDRQQIIRQEVLEQVTTKLYEAVQTNIESLGGDKMNNTIEKGNAESYIQKVLHTYENFISTLVQAHIATNNNP